MRVREAVEKNYNALPGYKLIGYTEIAIPVFQRRIQILLLSQKCLPVVEQFVLSLFKEGLRIDDIKDVLGLNQQIIDEAWAGLIQKDYINNFTKTITDDGNKYLKLNKIEKLEKKEILIFIDGLTGHLSKTNTQLMTQKSVKEKELKAVKSTYSNISIENIDFRAVKKIYNMYKRTDSDNYSGDVLDIIEINGNTTKYRRTDVLFFQNERNELRILAYDDYHKVEEYEETLLSLENDGFSILDFCLDDYLNDKHVIELNQIIKNNPDECELVVKGNINFEWDNFLRAPKDELFIVTPLTNECKLNHAFIEQIGTLVEAGVKINYILSGKDFTSEYQKNHCLSLHKLSNKSNFTFKQVSFYLNKMIVDVSRSELLISIYEPIEIVSNGSKMGFNEIVYKIKGNTYSKIYDIVNRIENDCEMPKLESPNDIVSLRKNIEDIILLVKDCDSYMQNIDEIGWFGNGGIPELKRLKEVPLANNSENFRIFFDSLNKSLIESLEYNAKIKGKSKYFWNEFRSRYADLHKILDKIKTYRNKCNHLKLDELNRKKYYSFLEHDLNGCIPEFIESGFLIIQQKTISELQTELKRLLLNIRN